MITGRAVRNLALLRAGIANTRAGIVCLIAIDAARAAAGRIAARDAFASAHSISSLACRRLTGAGRTPYREHDIIAAKRRFLVIAVHAGIATAGRRRIADAIDRRCRIAAACIVIPIIALEMTNALNTAAVASLDAAVHRFDCYTRSLARTAVQRIRRQAVTRRHSIRTAVRLVIFADTIAIGTSRASPADMAAITAVRCRSE